MHTELGPDETTFPSAMPCNYSEGSICFAPTDQLHLARSMSLGSQRVHVCVTTVLPKNHLERSRFSGDTACVDGAVKFVLKMILTSW